MRREEAIALEATEVYEDVTVLQHAEPANPLRRQKKAGEKRRVRPRERDSRYLVAREDIDWDTPAYQRRAK